MNYRYAYEQVAKAAFVLDTPGPTPADIRRLPHKIRQRPFFPLDEDIENPEMTIVAGRRQ